MVLTLLEEMLLMKPELTFITPEKAKYLMSLNYKNNRKIRKSTVEKYVSDMKNGKWREAMPDSVLCISADEQLLNGQHRLTAVIDSETSHYFWVSNSVPVGYYYGMDNGSPRKASDFINEKNATFVAALSNRAFRLQGGAPIEAVTVCTGSNRPTRDDIIDTYNNDNELIVECVSQGRRMNTSAGEGTPTDYATFIYLVKWLERDEFLDDFIEEYSSPSPTVQPISYIKSAIMKKGQNKGKGGRISSEWVVGCLLHAYEAYRVNETISTCSRAKTFIKIYNKYISDKLSNDCEDGHDE